MIYTLQKTDSQSSARAGILKSDHGVIETPVFMPVGTVGAVKTFSPEELDSLNSQIILGNTYHLFLRPGIDIINKVGGLHKFTSWRKPILTDSGGFQVFSLARLNKISDEGVEFQSHIDGSRHMLSPESSMKIQRNLGADIIMAFDECPPGNTNLTKLKKAVDRTSIWMRRCSNWLKENPPLYDYEQTIFPIIQGGVDNDLRKQSIEELLLYSKCGIAIGGLAVGEEKQAMMDTIEFCTEFLPISQPRYLMGVGKPTDIINAVRRGIDMFDCVLPTRNGRNGHIFTSKGVINIRNQKYKEDFSKLDSYSSHQWGTQFSKAYVRHLFNINEVLGIRIASTLNLAFYQDLMVSIRKEIRNSTFGEWSRKTLKEMKHMKGM